MSVMFLNRPRKLIVTLAACCILAGALSWSAMAAMRQDDLDQQAYAALKYGNTPELEALLTQGADPNYVRPNSGSGTNVTTLMNRILHRRASVQGEFLLAGALNGLANEEPRRPKRNTAKLKAMHVVPPPMTCSDPMGKVRILLAHHADPNRSYFNSNPLLHAIGMNRADAVKLLLQFGADPDAPAANGDTARKSAKRFKYASIVALMSPKPGGP